MRNTLHSPGPGLVSSCNIRPGLAFSSMVRHLAHYNSWVREPGLVAFYDIQPGSGAGLFFNTRAHWGLYVANIS